MLSWNGALENPEQYPRFCPGQQMSMIIVKAILRAIQLNGNTFGDEKKELLDVDLA